MNIIIQKFGGTSVATSERRLQAVRKIVWARNEGYKPVVVVSAMGRRGAPYATDTLIDLAKGVSTEITPRELDLLVSCGEVISTVVMVQTLRTVGYEAVALTGAQAGILTDDNFGEARIIAVSPEPLLKHIQEGRIPVVAGFQGCTPTGEITTLGRGASDTTATALGVALNAEVVEIYSDVDGVMSVDPKIVPEAKTLAVMTYREICEMANHGAKVMHPRAVQIAMEKGIPVRVRSTFSDTEGTLITHGDVSRVITGITNVGDIARIEVEPGTDMSKSEAEVRTFKALADARISVDFINITENRIVFTVKEDLAGKALSILQNTGFRCNARPGCAKISVIGAGMQDVPGVMARVVEVLYKAGIPIIQTVDSEITISCLVDRKDMERAVKVLFTEFGLAG